LLIEPADQVEQQLAAGLCERQITEFVENAEVEPGEAIGDAALSPGASFGLQSIDQVDRGIEAATGAGADAGAGNGYGKMAFSGAGTAAPIRAAARRQLQASINFALGSAIASIRLSVPVVALAPFWIGQPLELGISAGASVLMALGFVVAIITYGTGRTNLLSSIEHLVLLAPYIFTVFAP
jgi:hypothetical protein